MLRHSFDYLQDNLEVLELEDLLDLQDRLENRVRLEREVLQVPRVPQAPLARAVREESRGHKEDPETTDNQELTDPEDCQVSVYYINNHNVRH